MERSRGPVVCIGVFEQGQMAAGLEEGWKNVSVVVGLVVRVEFVVVVGLVVGSVAVAGMVVVG